MASEQLLDQLSQKTGQTRDEIQEKILEKTRKFSGLLNEDAALVLLAKEAGITQTNHRLFSPTPLNQLSPTQGTADVIGRVKRVFETKTFPTKKGTTATKATVIISDATGETFVSFWNSDAEMVTKIKTSDVLALHNVTVREFNSQINLNFGYQSKLELNPANFPADLPSFEKPVTPIANLSAPAFDVTVVVKVDEVFPIKEFSRPNSETGMLQRVKLTDETGEAILIAWNQKTSETSSLKPRQQIKIEHARAKHGLQGGMELHADQSTKITVLSEPTENE